MKFFLRQAVCTLFLFSVAVAMEMPQEKFDLFYSGNTQIDEQIVTAIKQAKKGSTIILAQLFLTHKKITDALAEFLDSQQGTVELLVDQRHGKTRGIAQWLENKGAKLQLAKGLHVKHCIISDDPRAAAQSECVDGEADLVIRAPDGQGKIFFMSENLSTLANQHLEYALYSEDPQVVCDNIAAHKEGVQFMQLTTPDKKQILKDRPVQEITPAKPGTILTTAGSDILECTRLRMLKPLENGMKEQLRIATMTFDSPKIAEALKQKAQNPNVSVQLIVDGSVLQSKKGRELLAGLKENGVEIFIYNPNRSKKVWGKGAIPMLQHAKIVYRLRESQGKDPEVLSIFYTGNLAEKSNIEFNMASFHLNDQSLGEKAVKLLDQLVKESEPYDQIDLEVVEQRAQVKKEMAAKKAKEKRESKKK